MPLLNDAHTALAAGRCRYIDLGVAVVRIAPAPAFEQTVRSGDAAKRKATGQIATLINHATPQLAYIQGFSARMLAGGQAAPRTNPAHEQHARAVIAFKIINVRLETRGVCDAYTSSSACLS